MPILNLRKLELPERFVVVTPETRRQPLIRHLKYGGLKTMAALLNIPRLGGYAGELRAHKSFLEGLPDGSIVLSDVMMPTLKGITQVQVVQKMGKEVSSIAVRNRRGKISGRERDRMWNWRLDRKKDTFPNQNSQARQTSRWNFGPKSGPDGC